MECLANELLEIENVRHIITWYSYIADRRGAFLLIEERVINHEANSCSALTKSSLFLVWNDTWNKVK